MAPAWMSSSAEGCEAAHATDGQKMVSTLEQSKAQTAAEDARPWWEVDLGREQDIDSIDVWEGKHAAPPGAYPPIRANRHSVLPFEVLLLSTSWAVLRSRRFTPGDIAGGGGVFSWRDIGVRGRYVRVRLLESEASPRALSLLEVQVWAWEGWNCSKHCLRGACPDHDPVHGTCVCETDSMGVACDASVLTDHVFLPPPDPDVPRCEGSGRGWPGGGCLAGGWDRDGFEEAVGWISAMQSPATCTSGHAMVMGYHPGGLAASLSLIASMLSMSLSLGKAMLLWRRAEWFYADPAECADRQMSCFFAAWHNCSKTAVDTFDEGAFHLKVEEAEATRGAQPFAWVPPQFKGHGLFWWRAALSSFLFRLTPEMLREIAPEAAMARLGLEGREYIGVHARLGDSCVKWRELFGGDCVGLDEHVSSVRLLHERYGASTVFVASDDPHAAGYIRARMPGLTVVAVDEYREVLEAMDKTKDTWTENRLREGEIAAGQLLRSTLLDVLLLSRARFFVGHLASNLSRLALSLAAAHWGGVVPFVSVDGPWCYHWQLCCDVDRHGVSHMCS